MRWDDPELEVGSDTPLRRRYRALQSWYRENRLNARFATEGPSGRRHPVGSLLDPADVRVDRALNFLCDPQILAFVERRSVEVADEGGSAEPGRLFHNMLSSMPMAFSVAAALSDAPDANSILATQLGFGVDDVGYVTAEWCPRDPDRRIGRTAFDIAARFRDDLGARILLGVETKYTESPTDKAPAHPRWIEFSDSCGWFQPGAAEVLSRPPTNQIWRNALLAERQECLRAADRAYLAVIGLADDDELWAIVDTARSGLMPQFEDRIRPVTWELFIARLGSTSLGSFAGQFTERYLDLNQFDSEASPSKLRRATENGAPHGRRFADAPRPQPSEQAMGEQLEWGRWLPTIWRTVEDESSPVAVPVRPPPDLNDSCAWWTPCLHLMLYGLGWPSPALGIQNWLTAGRPLQDARLRTIEAIYGRHIEAVASYLWYGYAPFEELSSELGLPAVERPDPPEWIARTVTPAMSTTPNPVEGGQDPLHLSVHTLGPIAEYEPASVELVVGDLATAGPPRATLICETAVGWYRALQETGDMLPANVERQGWRIDVLIRPVGHIGLYRRSRESGRWFAGRHRWHQHGIPAYAAEDV